MTSEQKLVGIQAIGLGGSFHEIAARDYFQITEETRLVPYLNHQQLMEAFHTRQIDELVIAVDNTVSGRVITAVNALNGLPRSVHVVGSKVVPIEQRLLYAPDTRQEAITAVMSQRPALDQVSKYIASKSLHEIECDDTLQAAEIVFKSGGRIDGFVVAAIASSLAGITLGLEVGEIVNNRPDNATKFWRLSREKSWDTSGTHASITFDLPANAPGSLLRAIKIISNEQGYDITDFDSHLHPYSIGKRSFYAELARPPTKNPKKLISSLHSNGIHSRLLGIYDSEDLLIGDESPSTIPQAITHDMWAARKGLQMTEGAPVLYVEASNVPKSLLGMLKCLTSINIDDLSRPTVPLGNNFARGFYVAINPKTQQSDVLNSVQSLRTHGFVVSHFSYKNGKLVI